MIVALFRKAYDLLQIVLHVVREWSISKQCKN